MTVPIARFPHLAQGFRRQGADPVVLIPHARTRPGTAASRCRLADHAQRLDGFGPYPVVAVGHRLDQGRGGLDGRLADRSQGLGRSARTTLSGLSSPSAKKPIVDVSNGPTCAIASAAAARTDSSRSCNSGTSAGTAGAAARFIAPSARAAAAFTGALASCSKSTSAATVAPSSPPTWPRASAA